MSTTTTASLSYDSGVEDDVPFDPSASILEEFLDSTTTLPAELKRTATLLREVDAKYMHDVSLLKQAQEDHLDGIARKALNVHQLQALVQTHKKRLDTRLEEKKALVQQLFDTTNRSVKRLNRDIKNFQGLLKETGELDDMALILAGDLPMPPPSTRVILNTSSTKAMGTPIAISPPSNMASGMVNGGQPQSSRRGTGIPQPGRSNTPPSASGSSSSLPLSMKSTPGAMVAARTNAEGEQELWILARVMHATADGNVALVDAENNAERFVLSPDKIVVLVENEEINHAKARLGKNKRVMALYPDTTSFYAANVVQAPFRCVDPDPLVNGKVCITCMFDDDEDATGVIPKRSVPVRYVFIEPR